MYGAIIAVAAVALVLIGLFVGYQHAALAQKYKDEHCDDAGDCAVGSDEVFAHQVERPAPLRQPPSSKLVKRPVTATRQPPMLTL